MAVNDPLAAAQRAIAKLYPTSTAPATPTEDTTPPGYYSPLQPGDLAGAVGMDPQAQTDIANAQSTFNTGANTANAKVANDLAGFQAQIPLLANQYSNANLATNQQMAGRGVLKSGLTQVGLGQNRANYDTALSDNSRQQQGAVTDWQGAIGGLYNDLTNSARTAVSGAASRYMQNRTGTPDQYSATYGVGAAGAVPDAQNFGSMPTSWLNGPTTPATPTTPTQKKP